MNEASIVVKAQVLQDGSIAGLRIEARPANPVMAHWILSLAQASIVSDNLPKEQTRAELWLPSEPN